MDKFQLMRSRTEKTGVETSSKNVEGKKCRCMKAARPHLHQSTSSIQKKKKRKDITIKEINRRTLSVYLI
jgi:hypothetical protein